MKTIIIVITSLLIITCGIALYQILLIKETNKTIRDREKTIITYKMAIEALAKSNEVNVLLLKDETDFEQ